MRHTANLTALLFLILVMSSCQPRDGSDHGAQPLNPSQIKGQVLSRKIENPVFVFNNAFNTRGTSYVEIADLLADLGYHGIEHREVEGIFDLKKELDRKGLRIFTDYLKIDIDSEPHYLEDWKEVIPKLAGTDLVLWVHVHSDRFEPSDQAADEIIVPILQELADYASAYGIRVAAYPHANLLVETAEDSYRIAEKVNRENVGAVFNLTHFLWADQEENLEQLIKKITPRLMAVSIAGADRGNYEAMHMNELIQPLGQGNYDVYRVVQLLLDNGYKGPIGFQCYQVPGEPVEFLKTSMNTWNKFKAIYESGANWLSTEEKSAGWELLFDGYSSRGWRGITRDEFPSSGWEIVSGEFRTIALDGAESGNGGDVITTKEYADFELSWEWKMLTKGGNSGLKYYVKEELTSEGSYGYGLEYQILDDDNHPWMLEGKMSPNDYHTIGALYEFFAPSESKVVNPLGQWNTSRIISQKNQVEHWLNGKRVLSYERGGKAFKKQLKKSKFKDIDKFGQEEKGHILLQDHGSQVYFRNIKIRELY